MSVCRQASGQREPRRAASVPQCPFWPCAPRSASWVRAQRDSYSPTCWPAKGSTRSYSRRAAGPTSSSGGGPAAWGPAPGGRPHRALSPRVEGADPRIDFVALVGRGITVYGQQEVVKDLVAARLA